MKKEILAAFEEGTVFTGKEQIAVSSLPWNAHKDFSGVFLKNMITPDMGNNQFSCHLVRIEPNKKIGMHTHPNSIELHEVLNGSGVCSTESGEIPYKPGVLTVLGCNSPHEVRAGEDGLFLFAKFITVPAGN